MIWASPGERLYISHMAEDKIDRAAGDRQKEHRFALYCESDDE
jgi:hypothetical protein